MRCGKKIIISFIFSLFFFYFCSDPTPPVLRKLTAKDIHIYKDSLGMNLLIEHDTISCEDKLFFRIKSSLIHRIKSISLQICDPHKNILYFKTNYSIDSSMGSKCFNFPLPFTYRYSNTLTFSPII